MSICHLYDFRPVSHIHTGHICGEEAMHVCEYCFERFCSHKAAVIEHGKDGRPLVWACADCLGKQIGVLARAWATLDPDDAIEGLQAAALDLVRS